MSTVNLTCNNCKCSFTIPKKEYNRQIKTGRSSNNFYCSRRCSAMSNPKFLYKTKEQKKKLSELNKIRMKNNRHSFKSKFSIYLHLCRKRKHKIDIDANYLETLWNTQNNLCAISKIPIHIKQFGYKNTPFTASLDRIDSSKGYIKNNVQFVAYSINLAKNSFKDYEVIELLETIKRT